MRTPFGRARAMVPALRGRAAQAEKDRVMPPETLADLHASGILRTLQPRRWGGMEFDFVAYVDFCYELARGCASTAWNFGNLQVHHWMLRCTTSVPRVKSGARIPRP